MNFLCANRGPAVLITVLLSLLLQTSTRAATPAAGSFEHANKLYEQEKYQEAAAAYQHLVDSGLHAPAIFFNLGNAWFKAGEYGRAVAAYLRAERLAPRDPSIRFNLDFVRRKVTGQTVSLPFWQRWLRRWSINEWALASAAAVWLWLLLLAAREFRPKWKTKLQGYTLWSGILAGTLTLGLGAAVYDQTESKTVVIVVPEAIVRYGPLEESPTFYKLKNGAEARLLDEIVNSPTEAWLQVEDSNGRLGWLKRDQVVIVFSELSRRKTA